MCRTTTLVMTLFGVVLVGINLLEGQQMDEGLLKSLIALKSGEIPGFSTKGGVTFGTEKHLTLAQSLWRTGTGIPGKDPTEIVFRLHFLPNREIAYQVALSETVSQRIYLDGAGMPEGSWTGLPVGEKSWATAPKSGGVSFTSNLVVWDDRLALRVIVKYPPLDLKAKNLVFFPIEREDLELGELAARLILAKANLLLLGWRELPTVRLVANGRNLEAKKTKEGAVFVPVQALLKELGGKAERKLGVIEVFWRGKKVTLPIGARVMLVGKEKVRLSLPVLLDSGEAWVDAAGMVKGLGLAMRWEKGQLVLAQR
ncbi:hypothetical protein HRbin17_01034 [bacterium HR17]|uniref:Copper amine oxidase-like N-terminal domain-containing protein n=1 Tax=Candidatus Fervidibacter japonicus TaxID=2035412 RepID=A0A2H5XBE9_9BACT|nr:hypothetical protein HRbin17_01034 [bacterium HR17]